jgi:6-pyruvoyltetrahydropterin/6-carboxytetrahydropterin synthase
MYTLAVRREFIARHFLVGGDWGPENNPNSHHYVLELQLAGEELDRHGFLVDIVDVDKHLDALVAYYKDRMLNELPEFSGLNPSLEHFARILCKTLEAHLPAAGIGLVRVQLWENESAWAAFEIRR